MIGFLTEILFYQPTFNLLIFFYNLFGGNLGWAILMIALVAKLVTYPITAKQLKSAEKMKVFQQKSAEVRKKYEKNPNKMNDELMKLSSKYMPAQLAGCLPLIITIILLIQVRNVVINLVNQGYHAFNKVAYVQNFEIPEDSVKFEASELKDENIFKIRVDASNGNSLEKEIKFFVVDDEKVGKNKVKEEQKRLKNLSDDEKQQIEETEHTQKESDIAVFVENFEDGNFVFNDNAKFEVYLRAPSNETIENINVSINDVDYTANAEVSKGRPMNIEFGGMNLTMVGRDYIGNWMAFAPYFALSIFLGISQYGITAIQMSGQGPAQSNKKKTEKKKKDEPENMDFAEAMQQSSKQMMFIMPLMTVAISLGYLGGANLFPAGVSLFWTAQNAFVIIQLAFTKKEKVMEWVKERYNSLIVKKDNKTQNGRETTN